LTRRRFTGVRSGGRGVEVGLAERRFTDAGASPTSDANSRPWARELSRVCLEVSPCLNPRGLRPSEPQSFNRSRLAAPGPERIPRAMRALSTTAPQRQPPNDSPPTTAPQRQQGRPR
jgi:hypothetical protein